MSVPGGLRYFATMRNAMALIVVVLVLLVPTLGSVLLVQRMDAEHLAKRQKAERWTIEMGWRPLSTVCEFASRATVLWGPERCQVTALREDGDVFSVHLGCDVHGCAYWSMQQIRLVGLRWRGHNREGVQA